MSAILGSLGFPQMLKWSLGLPSAVSQQAEVRSLLMRNFLKKIVNNDRRAKQIFRLYFDRKEISEEQFYKAISS